MPLKKILVVDDDADVRSILTKILSEKGFQTDEASSGKDAIEKATSEDFDIAILDLMMPEISGMDVLIELKKVKPKTKIIMITGFATIDNAVQSIKKGASDYITKPFKISDLDATIKRTLEEAKFDTEIQRLDLDFTLGSLSSNLRRNIIKLLNQNKGMHLMEITRALDIEDHTKIVFHLKVLKESGIIKKDKEKKYFLTKEGEKTLSCLNILEDHLSK
jgi:DNA-binding NtrC family response regulator